MLGLGRAAMLGAAAFSIATLASACWNFEDLQTGAPRGLCDGGPCVESGPGPVGDAQGDAPLECKPGDVSTLIPKWHPPSGRQQKKCTDAQIDSFASCLFSPSAAFKQCLDYLDQSG